MPIPGEPISPGRVPRTYADQEAYDWWTGTGGTAISLALFRSASSIVDEALIGAVYAVDTDSKPTDTRVANALSDAVCAQVEWMDATGDTSGVGDTIEVDSASIGSVSFSGQRRTNGPTRLPSGRNLAPAALAVLRVEGLLPVTVLSRG